MNALQGIAWLYLKLFLFNVIISGLCMLLISPFIVLFIFVLVDSITLAIIITFAMIVFFLVAGTLLVSLAGGTAHILAIKSKDHAISDETLKVKQVRDIPVGVPYDEAFGLCVSSLKAVAGSRIVSEDRGSGRISARVSLSWWSWGEKVLFEVRRQADGGSLIRVSSWPAIPTTVVDYGKNLVNVEKIAGRLNGQAA